MGPHLVFHVMKPVRRVVLATTLRDMRAARGTALAVGTPSAEWRVLSTSRYADWLRGDRNRKVEYDPLLMTVGLITDVTL